MAGYNYDPAGDLERLKRKRLAAARLGERTWDPYPALHDAGAFKVANWGDAIAQVAKSVASARADADLTKDEAATRAAQQVYENDQLRKYESLKAPKEVVDTAGGEGDDAVSTTRRVPGDRRAALASAMASRIPALLEQARNDMKEDRELLRTPGASTSSRVQAYEAGDPSALKPEVRQTVINGQSFSTTDEGLGQRTMDARDQFQPIRTPAGANPGQIWQQNKGTGQISAEGSGPQVVNNVDTRAANAFETGAMTDWLKRLSEGKTRMAEITQRQPLIREALSILPDAETGFGANVWLKAREAARKFNLDEDEVNKIGKSQTLRGALAPAVFDMLKALRPASNVDLEWSKTVQLADLSNDPRALERALQAVLAADANDANEIDKNYKLFTSTRPDQAETASLYAPPAFSYNEKDDGITFGPTGKFQPRLYGSMKADQPPAGAMPADGVGPPGAPPAAAPAAPTQTKPGTMSDKAWNRMQELRKKQKERGY